MLSVTRSRARRLLPRFSRTRNNFDNFCLRGRWGIRAGYPSAQLLRSLPRRSRKPSTGRIVIALTANNFYALDGVRPGAGIASAKRRLKLRARPFHVGLNYWYLVPGRAATGVLKVRHGHIQEVGIASRSLAKGRTAQRRLMRSFNDG